MTGKGTTIDIGAWLRDHGFGQYEATFRQNEIDVDILPALTESHLEKLGVPLGHRIRLLKAIASLRVRTMECRAKVRMECTVFPLVQPTAGSG